MTAQKHDLLSSLGTLTMALDILYTLPIADEQRQWLEIIKRNAEEAEREMDEVQKQLDIAHNMELDEIRKRESAERQLTISAAVVTAAREHNCDPGDLYEGCKLCDALRGLDG